MAPYEFCVLNSKMRLDLVNEKQENLSIEEKPFGFLCLYAGYNLVLGTAVDEQPIKHSTK